MRREEFLARVRTAAESGRAYRVHVPPVAPNAGYMGAGPDLCGRFAEEVNAVGGRAHFVDGLSAARETLEKLLTGYAPRLALCWEHPLLHRLGLDDVLSQQKIERISYANLSPLPQAEQRARMLAADVAISSTTWAIAETGSLAVASGPGSERAGSLYPPVHIAIVSADQILPDLFDLFAKYQPSGDGDVESGNDSPGRLMPTNLALITGPSKTGDVELKLTTGVHGPGEWHVIIVRS